MNPSEPLQVDVAIVGTGQAAPSLAVALAADGETVALIEGHLVGGTCVNTGCTPTKTLRKSARVAHMARRAAEFGVRLGSVEIDFAAAMARMQARADSARSGLEEWLAGQARLHLIRGWGRFNGVHEAGGFSLQAGDQQIVARRVYLNTGTRPVVPSIHGLDTVPFLDNVSLLQLRSLPRHLVILGGSYIGLEMGQIFRRLGSQVSIVETGPRITGREDADVSEAIRLMLADEGIAIHCGQPVDSVAPTGSGGEGVRLRVGGRDIEGSHLLVATGRQPNTERLDLEKVGVKVDGRDYVPTDGQLRTNVPGIWALGDINKRGAFTHTSYHDHEIVLANHRREKQGSGAALRSADDRTMAYAMFTDPPLGRVGIGEAEARALVAKGRKVLMATHAMADVSRAKEESETTGLIKLLVDGGDGRFLGAAVFGIQGDEVIQVISNFMATGASYQVLKDALPVHPTVAEFLPTVLGKLKPLEA
ncbi:mercuric reductase [Variovorax sp. J22G21]|uniref:mercuric reductase n=1 Tax=Variovorax fucosicus TaxID=3053517 RepID=UPI00257778F7|nr:MULTISPECIES: mercuric reductase [unclassified Variovorax]MDM0042652.1 mercuric reductase [Variovorax sp. J22R193]MDM0061257.1 mercuric reductase [Variovorax sp. J22G21]